MEIKQSAGDVKFFADLMINAPKDRKICSAVDALTDPSFCLSTPVHRRDTFGNLAGYRTSVLASW